MSIAFVVSFAICYCNLLFKRIKTYQYEIKLSSEKVSDFLLIKIHEQSFFRQILVTGTQIIQLQERDTAFKDSPNNTLTT